MPPGFEFITTSDKPALLAMTNIDWLETAKSALQEMGFKVHTANNHTEFLTSFHQIPYQVVIVEELFAANRPEENQSLIALQNMPMSHRRHAVVVLVGDSFSTFNPMQAYQLSVQAVVNRSEMFLLLQLLQKVVADSEMFLQSFRAVQQRLIEAKSVT
jgi:DNA-binding NtrC family response regulator